jgi:hypothetical protein
LSRRRCRTASYWAALAPLSCGGAPGARPGGTAADALLGALADAGETARAALITATGYSPRAVTDALAALTESGRIVKTGHGRYALAPPGDPDTTAA